MLVSSAGPVRYEALVQHDRVHASLYTDPRIFADELEQIFYRGWVFVGHESEIRRPGDFITRHVGTQAVIMARGSNAEVSVLLNRCAHRGTMICAAASGNTRTFTCPFLLPEDVTIASRNQAGLHATSAEWLQIVRGLNREYVDAQGRLVSHVTDETTNRAFWAHYRTVMTASDDGL